MADKSLDQRTRKIDQTQIRKGNELEMMQQAQNQFLAIQAERQRNLSEQRTIMGMEQQQNATLMEGAQMAAIGGNQAIPQTVDPRTQAVLNKYGMGRPKFMKSTQHTQQVTKQHVTINNTTNNTTTNNVNAGGYGGPVQGRALSWRTGGNDSTEKFKVWLANSYARQQQQAKIREREYEKREDSLVRSGNKMMRKLEGIGKTMGKILDPRNVGNTLVNPLKMLFIFMGFHNLIKNWGKLMGFLRKAENFMTGLASSFGLTVENGKINYDKAKFTNQAEKKLGWIGTKLVIAFGGNPYRGETVADVLKNTFIGSSRHPDGLWEQMKRYFKDKFEERSEAIKQYPIPDLRSYLNGDKPDFIGLGKELMAYLGDITSIALSGSGALKKIISRNHMKADRDNYSGGDEDKYETVKTSGLLNTKYGTRGSQKNANEYTKALRESNRKNILNAKTDVKVVNGVTTAREFLGEDKVKVFEELGLRVDNLTVEDHAGGVSYYNIGFTGKDGLDYNVVFDREGRTSGYVTPGSKYYHHGSKNANWYRGELIGYGDANHKSITGTSLSSREISEDGSKLLSGEVGFYRQFNELAKMAKTAKSGTAISEEQFAFGINRVNNFVKDLESDGYVMIPDEALTSVLNLSQEEVAKLRKEGDLVKKTYYTVRRRLTLIEACTIAQKNSPEVAALLAALNTEIYTYGKIGQYTAIKDYFPLAGDIATHYWMGKSAKNSIATKIGKVSSASRIKKFGKAKGLSDAAIKKAQNLAAKKIAKKLAAKAVFRAIPYVGWGLLAYDAIELLYTALVKRNPAGSALEEWKKAKAELDKLPKYIGDTVDEFEYLAYKEADDSQDAKHRVFDMTLIDSDSGYPTTNPSDAAIEFTAIKGSILRGLLKDKMNIDGDTYDMLNIQDNDEYKDSKTEDIAHLTSDFIHTNYYGDAEYSSRDAGNGEWIDDLSGSNSVLRKTEVGNEIKRDKDIKEAEQAAAAREAQAENDAKEVEALGLKYLLPENPTKADKIKYLKTELNNAGITDPMTRNAIIGNLLSESGLNEGIKERGGGPGNGIAQWTDEGRKKAVIDYINGIRTKQGKPKIQKITDATFEEQVSALLHNTKDGLVGSSLGKETLSEMSKYGDLRGKTAAFMDTWEKNWASSPGAKKSPDTVYVDKKGKPHDTRNNELTRRTTDSWYSVTNGEVNKSILAKILGNAVGLGVDGVNEVVEIGGKLYNRITGTELYKKGAEAASETVDKAGNIVNTVAENLRETLSTDLSTSLGKVGREYNDYYYYLRNHGDLPSGLSHMQWEEAVHNRTGFYPSALTDVTDGLYSEVSPTSVTSSYSSSASNSNKDIARLRDFSMAMKEGKLNAIQKEEKAKEETRKTIKEMNTSLNSIDKKLSISIGAASENSDLIRAGLANK